MTTLLAMASTSQPAVDARPASAGGRVPEAIEALEQAAAPKPLLSHATPEKPAADLPAAQRRLHAGADASALRRSYLWCLMVAFTVFNSIRILTYLPTIWAIHSLGDSAQHSLWTWVAWIGGNATMAAWLFESNGRRLDCAVAVSAANALMCLATCVTIVYYRF